MIQRLLQLVLINLKPCRLNLSFFIAKRIAFNKQKSFSRFIIRITVFATALSVAGMILALSFVNGFQHSISEKIFNFWGHIRVQHFELGKSLVAEEVPIKQNDTIVSIISSFYEVKKVQSFATKSAVIEFNKNIEAVLFKGVNEQYDFKNLQPFLQKGRWVQFFDSSYQKEIVISEYHANLLEIKISDTILIHFINSAEGKSNSRKLLVCGIYKTGIEEYDKLFGIGDIRLIRRLSNWNENEIGGYEVFLKDYKNLEKVNNAIYDKMPNAWISRSMKEIFPNIFDWLNIQDVNRNVIIIIMSLVAIINMISCLLILVLERTRMTGILKAFGSDEKTIQKIFFYYASYIATTGVFIGFIAGVGISLLQLYTGFIKLDEAAYYVATAPIFINWLEVMIVCMGALLLCFISLLLPLYITRKIKPIKAIQFR